MKKSTSRLVLVLLSLLVWHGCSKCSQEPPKADMQDPALTEDVAVPTEIPSEEQLSKESAPPPDEQEMAPLEDAD